MIDPRLRTIRFWMITASVCGGCLADHGWAVYFLATYAMAPLGMFMPVFAVSACPTRCTSVPSSASITIGGIVSDICASCEDYNGTTVVSGFAPSGSTCTTFEATGVHSCDDTATVGGAVQMTYNASGAQTKIVIATFVSENLAFYSEARFQTADLGATPIDCAGVGSPALSMISSTNEDCDMSATTASVVVTP